MKIKLLFLILICATIRGYAQPANDTCGTAQSLVVGVGSCNSILYTNVAATTIGNPATPACWLPNTMSNTVWFSFSATKADIEISTNFAGTLADTQIAVFSGACGSLTQLACQEDINTATGLLHTDVILHGLTIGNTYYIAVDGKGNTTGTFGVCVQESQPIGPPLAIQDCVGAQTLCNLGNIVVADGTGGIGLSQENPSCFGAPGERSSGWYSFTAATNGNLCFTITPNAPIDYDFAVYNTTASCPGTELVCNWDPESGAGITGLGCATATQCETCLAVVAGQTYTILIDRFTANSSSGFTMGFAGTSATFASPNPTFTAVPTCVGTAMQFTNTTNGNYTYSWNFGDTFTSSLENPTHTYASAGTFNVTLLVTAVPGGCQNSVTMPVTVSLPAVDAGIGGNVCPGSCLTLSGSANTTGFPIPVAFSNSTSFAIPDGSAVGVSSPIAVSGIVPVSIGATTIVSVCMNLTHTFDSDLDIFLQCPNGTRIELSTDNGSFDEDYTNTCFTPTATIPITSDTGPFTGTYSPEQSFNLLNGCNTNGTWQLFVQDDTGSDVGTIDNWTITLNDDLPPFSWSPTTGMTNATTLTPTVCPATTTTYTLTGNGAGGCVVADTVTVTVGGGSTANISYPAVAFCTSDAPKTVTLTGTGTFTGGIYSSTAGLTIDPVTGTITPATSTAGPYTITYTIPASGGCPAVATTTPITINPIPNAGTDGGTAICDSNVAVINLFTLITGEQAGGTWTRSSGTGGAFNAGAGTFTPTVGATSSIFIYTMTGTAPCTNDTSQATITISAQPNSGTDGGTAICDSSVAAIDLFGLVTGEQAGGTWTRSSGTGGAFNAGAGTFTPAAGVTSSIFIYTLTGTAPCTNDTSQATITISAQPNAGTDGGTAICDSSVAAIDLFGLITGEQTGGTWTRSSGTGGAFNAGTGTFTPAAGATSSIFIYTLTGPAPCTNDTSQATITINTQPNAGTDGGTAICDSSAAAISLFGLITGEQTGGTWTRSSGAGGTFNAGAGTFTPAAGATSSLFIYTLTGTASCTNDTSQATITISAQPNAGTDGGTALCDSSIAAIDLFGLITGEQTGGTWTRSSGTGGAFNAGAGTFTPAAGATSSIFIYTLTGTAPCTNDTSQATITISAQPNAGTDGGTAICDSSAAAIDLFGLITGEQTGGTWTRSSGTGGAFNAGAGIFTPTAGATSSIFIYTLTGTAPCTNDTSQATITISAQPNAGTDGGTAICDSSVAAIDLFGLITGEQTGGTWTRSSGTGGTFNAGAGTFTPATGATSSIFTYTLTGTGPCTNDTSQATITISAQPNAGTDGGTAICDSSAASIDLFGLVTGEQTGGTWTRSSGTGGAFNAGAGTFTPTVGATSSIFIYTLTGTAPCIIDTSQAAITIIPTLTPVISCGISTTTSVQFNWSAVTGATGYAVSYQINANPIVTVGAILNVLTYIRNGLIPGDNVTITLAPNGGVGTCFASATQICSANNCTPPTASISYAGTPFCKTLTAAQNVTLTGTGIFTGGTYSSTAGLSINAATGAITPNTSTAGTYTVTYTIPATPNCTIVTATTSVTISALPTAVISYAGTPFCSSLTAVQNPTLNGTGAYAGGTFSSATGLSINSLTGVIIPSTSTAGTYTVTYAVAASSGCAAVTATTSITITALPTVAISYSGTPFCTSLVSTQLVVLVGTAAYSGGIYTSTTGLSLNSTTGGITPSTSTAGIYIVTYTVPASAGCSIVTATTAVTITALPTAVITYTGAPFCITDASLQPVSLNGTEAYTGGTYSTTAGLSLNSTTGAITPDTSTAGSYIITYTIAASAGCASVTAFTSVTIDPTIAPTINCGVSTTTSVQFNWAAVTGATGYDVFYNINANPIVVVGPIGNVSTYTVAGLNSGDTVFITLTPTGGSNSCFTSASQLCTANNCNPPTASISYSGTPFCTSVAAAQNVTLNGIGVFTGGVYSSSVGLSINAITGAITPNTSAVGIYTVTYTIAAATGCSPVIATTLVTIFTSPAVPILATTQPTCLIPTGTIVITGLPGLTYSFDGSAYTSTLIHSGLAVGSTHTVIARNAAGCISAVATSTITAQPGTPIAPVLIALQPTCALSTGTITIIGIAGLSYSFDGGAYNSTLIYSGLAAGSTHTVTAQNAAGCISPIATSILNIQPTTPAAPILVMSQPTCSSPTGTITITGVAGLSYSFDGATYSPALIYSGLTGGSTHTVTAQNIAGCISLLTMVTLNAQPATPANPILTPIQPTCTVSTGNITITGAAGLTYSFDGSAYTSTLVYNGLPAGSAHTVTAKNNLGCISLPATITLNIQPVTPIATATPNIQTICSGTTTAIALSSNTSGTTFSWTAVQTNVTGASNGSGITIAQILTTTGIISGQAVYTITPVANGCTGLPISVTITINPRPAVIANPTLETICSGDATDINLTSNLAGAITYNWTVTQIGVIGAVSGSGPHIAQALTTTGIVPGTVNYTITPTQNGCAGTAVVVTVTVNPAPKIIGLANAAICSGDTLNLPLVSDIPGTTFTWTAFENNANGAGNGNGNIITQTLNTTGLSRGTVIYAVTPTYNSCVGISVNITITVNPVPIPTLSDGIICVDQDSGTTTRSYVLNAGLNNANFDFEWHLDAAVIPLSVSNTHEAVLPGTYSVIATNTLTGCVSTEVFATVDAAYIAKESFATVTDAFTENPSIVVTVPSGTGPFLYQLDNGAWQTSNIFTGMSSGLHTVSVTDVNGCTDLKQEVLVIDYPKFFTPNGDGYNDTWNISALSVQKNSRIFIFDRYGKLIKEISPSGKGWDGTYNAHELPGTDYWFTVDYLEANANKTFKAHFSLKR
jgi:gliding motility-associated-like protein